MLGLLTLAVGIGSGTFFAGRSNAPDAAAARRARSAAFRTSFAQAKRDAFTTARKTAMRKGLARGRHQGEAAGSPQGLVAGSGDAKAQIAANQEAASEATPAPGTPGSTVCVTYQDYIPGVGCYPPVAPGQTEAPINCPPGEVPVGLTGACGRP